MTLIGEAVFARCLSAMKSERVKAAAILEGPSSNFTVNTRKSVRDVQDALYAAKIISYAQGFMLMRAATEEYNWNLQYGNIALIWRGGCIIRSGFLNNIKDAFKSNPKLENLLLDSFFHLAIHAAQAGRHGVAIKAIELGIPTPAISSGLAFLYGYRSARLPANLLQAQRDYFGAHTYERIDKLRGEFFHTDWIGSGGNVSSTTYTV